MNFKERLNALELDLEYARGTSNTEQLRELEAQHDEMTNAAWDEAYIRAAELGSPNSPDFEALRESIFEEIAS